MQCKVITLYQPWATLVVLGIKKFETRSWYTNHRGQILIHAALAHSDIGRALYEGQRVRLYGHDMGYTDHDLPQLYKRLPFGCIIGSVNIQSVIPTDQIRKVGNLASRLQKQQWGQVKKADFDRESLLGDLSPDRFAWELTNPRRFDHPIMAKGYQRLWNYDLTPEVLEVLYRPQVLSMSSTQTQIK